MSKPIPGDKDYDITRKKHGGNPRSDEAHQSTKKLKQRDWDRIIILLDDYDDRGLIREEAQYILPLKSNTVYPRFADLKAQEMIYEDGWRLTEAREKASICRLTSKGKAAAAVLKLRMKV